MNSKQMRSIFLKVRRVAAQLAEKCDFVTASRIKEAVPSCSKDLAVVGVEYKDDVERAQIVTAFVYGADLHRLNFSCNRSEDFGVAKYNDNGELLSSTNDKGGIVTIVLDSKEGK